MVILRESGHPPIGNYTFERVPVSGEIISIRQMDQAVYFEVAAIEHVITDPGKPADVFVTVKRR